MGPDALIRRSVWFGAPRQVEVRQELAPAPGPGEAQVRTLFSAISPGSEMLIYRGEFPNEIPLDASISALAGSGEFPLKYGYSAVGRVSRCGLGVDPSWMGRLVFAFQPHQSVFTLPVENLLIVPKGIAAEEAIFLPNMETAVNFVMDGAPRIGERVVVFGQGIVGLLTTALLALFPLACLVTLDAHPFRRDVSYRCGATQCIDPADAGMLAQLKDSLPGGADLVFELSGSPKALDQALAVTGFSGRVIIGSWYGQKNANLDLGGSFHRSRIQLVSSQVSTLAPELTGRWDKQRRFQLAWEMIRKTRPTQFITQRFPIEQAGQAYRLLDELPGEAVQVIFTYA